MIPLGVGVIALFFLGLLLGGLVNWAIYALAWRPRPISPWSPAPEGAAPRRWSDRVPAAGWLQLSREAPIHGPWFWLRPMLIEISMGVGFAALYWWEVGRLGLIQPQFPLPLDVSLWAVYLQFGSHVLLFCLLVAAAFIDMDEKLVPDEITVPGTLLGLVLATLFPLSLLPDVADRTVPPLVGVPISLPGHERAVAAADPLWLEPVTPISPAAWPPDWGISGHWLSLLVALGCYWLWCFALAPRIWRGRRGTIFGLRLIMARVLREFVRPPLRWLLIGGSVWIVMVWVIGRTWPRIGEGAWCGLLSSLVGLVGSGALVWAVRLIGTAALKREALGFGDVTLMMMVGTFLGWQACLFTFFLAPFAGLAVGLLQFLLRRDDVIPYVPYLCLAAMAAVVAWAPIWNWARPLFAVDGLVPAALVLVLLMLGVLLTLWQTIKTSVQRRAA
jgi:prepilin signal peptidase PulO-like enzyme (type II secretory pathway)